MIDRVRALAAGAALAISLSACPLPQPVPAVEGDVGITPPRILTETAQPAEGVVRVGADCPADAFVPFGGTIDHADLDDLVEARWFVDYAPSAPGVVQVETLLPVEQGTNTRRTLAEFRFFPARFALVPHVVEVVVSNGFFPLGRDPAGAAQPNRTPQAGYETQVFRWVVVYEPGARCQ